MKTIKMIGMFTVLAMLSACAGGKGNSDSTGNAQVGVTSEGNCTPELVSAWNNVTTEIKLVQFYVGLKDEEKTVHAMQVLKNACEILYPKFENVTCKAKVDYLEKTIDSNGYKQGCDAVKKALAPTSESSAAE